MKIGESLKIISAYPIPMETVQAICTARGVDADADFTLALAQSAGYKKAQADLYIWLSEAPNITQGEVHFSFSLSERAYMRRKAAAILNEAGAALAGDQFGYMGDKL